MTPGRARFARAALAAPIVLVAACGGGDDAAAPTSTPGTTIGDSVSGSDTSDTNATAEPATTETATGAADTTVPTTPVPTTPASSAPDTSEPATSEPGTGTTAPTTPETSDGGGWQDPTGTYAIDFPSDPTEQQLTADAGDGTTIPVTAYLAEFPGAAVIVSCVDSPEGRTLDDEQSLVESQTRALEQFGAELADSREIELQGRPGLEYRGAIGESGGVLGRTYVDATRVCNMLVVGEPAVVDEVAPPFLDSFEFLQEAA